MQQSPLYGYARVKAVTQAEHVIFRNPQMLAASKKSFASGFLNFLPLGRSILGRFQSCQIGTVYGFSSGSRNACTDSAAARVTLLRSTDGVQPPQSDGEASGWRFEAVGMNTRRITKVTLLKTYIFLFLAYN